VTGPFSEAKKVAVIGGGNSGVEAAIDLAGICAEVTVFEFADTRKADDVLVSKLMSLPNVSVVLGARTTETVGDGAKVTAIHWEDRASSEARSQNLDGVFVQIGLVSNSDMLKEVVATNRLGEIQVDTRGRTSAAGIFAAGDVTDTPFKFKQIVIAMGDGAKAALTAFEERLRQAS
jgi:alkyl hydroperoxide reductase subunit F